MKTYYWDFFGPQSQGTARHFEIHMGEFLKKNGIGQCETGTVSLQAGHCAAWCRSEEGSPAVETALRPKRIEARPG